MVVCVSVGLVGALVLYLVVRMRSNTRHHHHPSTHTADDLHSQMEWEDDIGLNITVNPLDETKVSALSAGGMSVWSHGVRALLEIGRRGEYSQCRSGQRRARRWLEF